ncbi:MAG TPA: hypothetical protein PLC54_07615, partial [Spirochaetales bacterium]|nr:hypothetical protein [Spirochaetales bacterium]
RRQHSQATAADLVALTGLPKAQVDAELPALADEYNGRMAVTESGEILYSFPRGFASRYRGFWPSLARTARALKKGIAAAAKAFFKVWIMLTLVGYFALFILLAILAVLASVAVSMSGERDSSSRRSDRGGLGGMVLVGRVFELIMRIWFYNEMFKTPGQRYRESELRSARRLETRQRRPLHKAVFSFVFGEPDTSAALSMEQKRTFVAMVRAKNGIVLLEDFMALSGLSPDQAERAINAYLYEFEGSPEVTEQGTIYFRFDALLRRVREDGTHAADAGLTPLVPFSANKASSNTAYALVNGVNLAFGSYFLFSAMNTVTLAAKAPQDASYLYWFTHRLLQQFVLPNPTPLLFIGLGIIPVAFSIIFWAVPALRALKLKRKNETIKLQNMRRILYAQALANPAAAFVPKALPEIATPSNPAAVTRALEELASYE